MSKKYIPYFQKLQDPLWQKKRLEVLEKADWKCVSCENGCGDGDKGETLHVHHCWYEKSLEPWEYPDECYQCLCKDCHKKAEETRLLISKILFTCHPHELAMILTGLASLSRGPMVGAGLASLIDYVGCNAGEVHKGMQRWVNLVASEQVLGAGRTESGEDKNEG